jgi:hypothetical protein
MSTDSYTLLNAEWPVQGLSKASAVPDNIIHTISSSFKGSAISQHSGYFSLGLFFIDIELLQQHHVQRPIDSSHVEELVDDFEKRGADRIENSGVVIGLGEGWTEMKNSSPIKYRIRNTFPFLDKLALSTGGPIGQVIRGGHRTQAIKEFSALPGHSDEGYWLYEVLLPSKSICLLYIYIYINLFSNQHLSFFHSPRLLMCK